MPDRAKKTTPTSTQAAQRSEEAKQQAQREATSAPAPRVERGRPALFGPADVLAMQRTVGNREVAKVLGNLQREALSTVVIQRVKIEEVELIDDDKDVFPVVVMDAGMDEEGIPQYHNNRNVYKRKGGGHIIRSGDETDVFYSEDGVNLVPVTKEMVDAFFNPRYPGFTQIEEPSIKENCEDYAKRNGFTGNKLGEYDDNVDILSTLINNQGNYILKIGSFHWLKVINTNGDSVIIQQKDGESAVYQNNYDSVLSAANYILGKHSTGIVYQG